VRKIPLYSRKPLNANNLNQNWRYIQIAFNHNLFEVKKILPFIPNEPNIIIEAGTPYIKLEGAAGIKFIRNIWRGHLMADMKVTDGAEAEVNFAVRAGANIITAFGSAPIETLDKFCEICDNLGTISVIDMLGVEKPLQILIKLKHKPKGVVIHKGRDEESSRSKLIRYRDIRKIKSKFPVYIWVAGGLTPLKVKSAFFNGADVAILNVVQDYESFEGLSFRADFRKLIPLILKEEL